MLVTSSTACNPTSSGACASLPETPIPCEDGLIKHTCLQVQVEALALQKWGTQEGLDQERQKRHMKRLERAKAKAGELPAACESATTVIVHGLDVWSARKNRQ